MSESRNMAGMILDRRAFLQLSGIAAFMLGLGALARLAARAEVFLRPPGARPEAEFLARCIKCQRCVEICPRRALTPVLLAQGPALYGTPRLSFNAGYCDLCGRCVAACPSVALRPFDPQTVRLGQAELRPERCIAWSWEGCTVCAPRCPLKAIALDDKQRPVVDAAKCNGCGLCENICPAASLRSYSGERGQNKGIVVVPIPGANS